MIILYKYTLKYLRIKCDMLQNNLRMTKQSRKEYRLKIFVGDEYIILFFLFFELFHNR